MGCIEQKWRKPLSLLHIQARRRLTSSCQAPLPLSLALAIRRQAAEVRWESPQVERPQRPSPLPWLVFVVLLAEEFV
jgi:hypothetical protein